MLPKPHISEANDNNRLPRICGIVNYFVTRKFQQSYLQQGGTKDGQERHTD